MELCENMLQFFEKNYDSPLFLSFPPVGNPSSIQKDSGRAGMTDSMHCGLNSFLP